MNLNVSKRPNSRIYLSINKTYRDKSTKKSRTKVVKSIGYLDELEKEYDDPITHFKQLAKEMTENESTERKIQITINMDECLIKDAAGMKNLGYSVPLKIYHELGLHDFLKTKALKENFEFNTNSIMIMLLISRILRPGSKKKAFEEKYKYFERFNFTLDDVYRALTHFDKISKKLQRFLYESIQSKYGSDTHIVYYDVTNYYFEITQPDDLRKLGKPKQNRKKPVVQMGLAMDADGLPMHYELFPGNKLDKETFRSVIGEVRKNYNTGRIIAVADMGIVTGDNIAYLVGSKPEKPKNGYVFSFSVRGGTGKFKEYVLDPSGYVDKYGMLPTDDSDFIIKSRRIARDINVTMKDGKTRPRTVYEKQVVFWSKKYMLKARAERAEIIAKAESLVKTPAKYNKATTYGAASYVNDLEYDKKSGEIINKGKNLTVNYEKMHMEELFDGYYAITTSEMAMTDWEIIDIYRGLWEIEETFKITKSDLASRPVFVSSESHINAHFLTCFIALSILRIIQKKTNKLYSVEKIIECLNNLQCMHECENIYLFGYRSEISDALSAVFGIDFSRKRLTLAEIKNLLGNVKK